MPSVIVNQLQKNRSTSVCTMPDLCARTLSIACLISISLFKPCSLRICINISITINVPVLPIPALHKGWIESVCVMLPYITFTEITNRTSVPPAMYNNGSSAFSVVLLDIHVLEYIEDWAGIIRDTMIGPSCVVKLVHTSWFYNIL